MDHGGEGVRGEARAGGTDTEELREGREEDSAGRARSARDRMGRGFTRGMGAFTAFKEALEETLGEARERGDLTSDRAKELLGRAVDRAREATSDARERFDFVTQPEFEALRRRVEELETRFARQAEAGPEVEPPSAPDPVDRS